METQQLFEILEPMLGRVTNGITIADARVDDLPLVYVNAAFERMTGYRASEVLGRNCRFLQGQGTQPDDVAAIRRALELGQPCRIVLLNYRSTGEPFWNDLQLTPVHDQDRRLTHIVGLQNDVTDSKRADELASRTAALESLAGDAGRDVGAMRRVLDAVPFGLLLIDGSLRLEYVNRIAGELLAVDRQAEWRGQPFDELINAPELMRLIPLPAAVHEQRFETILQHSSEPVGGAVLRTRLSDGGGDSDAADSHHIVVLRPMSETAPGQQDLEQLRRLSALGRMAAGFAHQVRNPLAAVRSLAEALREELDADDERLEYTQRILSLVERVEALVRRALRFTHSGAPRQQPIAPLRLVGQTLEVLDSRWRQAGETVHIELPADLPEVLADLDHSVEILMILIENALDAAGSPAGVQVVGSGPIAAYGSTAGSFVALDVIDRGPGIEAGVLAQIFDPFFTTKPRGTGLGLPIAMRLANEGSARLEVTTTAGQGTCFRLLLPVAGSVAGSVGTT